MFSQVYLIQLMLISIYPLILQHAHLHCFHHCYLRLSFKSFYLIYEKKGQKDTNLMQLRYPLLLYILNWFLYNQFYIHFYNCFITLSLNNFTHLLASVNFGFTAPFVEFLTSSNAFYININSSLRLLFYRSNL